MWAGAGGGIEFEAKRGLQLSGLFDDTDKKMEALCGPVSRKCREDNGTRM